MHPLEPLFSLTIMARVLNGLALGVGIVGFESDINPYHSASRNMLDHAVSLDSKLDRVAISTLDHPYALDLTTRKGFELLFRITNQA